MPQETNPNGLISERRYNIIRFYYGHLESHTIIASNVSLAVAQEHCRRDESKGLGWSDGYEEVVVKPSDSEC